MILFGEQVDHSVSAPTWIELFCSYWLPSLIISIQNIISWIKVKWVDCGWLRNTVSKYALEEVATDELKSDKFERGLTIKI